jgi:hypothetical protein
MKTVKIEMTLVLNNDAGHAWIAQAINEQLDMDLGEEMTYLKITEGEAQ